MAKFNFNAIKIFNTENNAKKYIGTVLTVFRKKGNRHYAITEYDENIPFGTESAAVAYINGAYETHRDALAVLAPDPAPSRTERLLQLTKNIQGSASYIAQLTADEKLDIIDALFASALEALQNDAE